MPSWAIDALKFAGLAYVLLFAVTAVYALLTLGVWRRHFLWRIRAPARRRGRSHIRTLAQQYRATGEIDPELQEVIGEIGEMG